MDKKRQKTSFVVASYSKLRKKMPEFLLQSLLLTLGVVIALAIGNWDEDRKRNREVRAILENLKSEALNNIVVVQIWQDYYEDLRLGIDSVLNDQKPLDSVFTSEGFMLEKLVDQEKPSSLLQETTWRTAQTTNLVQYFDYKVIYKLTDLYNYQDKVIQKEHNSINALFLDRNAFDPEGARTNLQMIRRMTLELETHHNDIIAAYRNVFLEIEQSINPGGQS